jgi:hypothetical protein
MVLELAEKDFWSDERCVQRFITESVLVIVLLSRVLLLFLIVVLV